MAKTEVLPSKTHCPGCSGGSGGARAPCAIAGGTAELHAPCTGCHVICGNCMQLVHSNALRQLSRMVDRVVDVASLEASCMSNMHDHLDKRTLQSRAGTSVTPPLTLLLLALADELFHCTGDWGIAPAVAAA